MKNKKWKRKAKRLIGKCIKNKLYGSYECHVCECIDECVLYCDACIPVGLGVREVEKRFKERMLQNERFKI